MTPYEDADDVPSHNNSISGISFQNVDSKQMFSDDTWYGIGIPPHDLEAEREELRSLVSLHGYPPPFSSLKEEYRFDCSSEERNSKDRSCGRSLWCLFF